MRKNALSIFYMVQKVLSYIKGNDFFYAIYKDESFATSKIQKTKLILE